MGSGFLDRLPPLIRENLIAVVLGVVGSVLVSMGAVSLLAPKQQPADIVFESGSETQASSNSPQQTKPEANAIMIDISGAVVNPGVYKLPEDARVADAIQIAGGFHADANKEWIAKSLNLAGKLSDSTKIYIPFVGETGQVQGAQSGLAESSTSTGLININSASEAQLDTLAGIGPVTAQKIMASRPYGSIQELVTKKNSRAECL